VVVSSFNRAVLDHRLTLGSLVVVLAYLRQMYDPLQEVSTEVAGLQDSMASAGRAFELLDEPVEVVEDPDPVPLHRAVGELELRDVSFHYAGSGWALHRVSFRVPAGCRLALTGRTGAGKTTVLSLLSRYFDPQLGQVLLDGIDVRRYRVADLRAQFAVVLQEPVLFSFSIAENIRYGRPDATDDEIARAAVAAGADEFIRRLPDGYDTLVGERGMTLSGGERQRIALARAFVKDAPILVLDEPTSSLDIRTEAEILAAVERLMAGRTCILITHRESALWSCDATVRIEQGRLVSRAGAVA
jgi:ATP-binding cassette, subfamily B, bacterial